MKQLETDTRAPDSQPGSQPKEGGHRGHGRWMMVACCVPMLLIATIAVAAGAGVGFLVIAVMCTLMMAAMMGGMSHGGGDEKGDRR